MKADPPIFAGRFFPSRFPTDQLPPGGTRFRLCALLGALIAISASSMVSGTGQADDETSSKARSRSVVPEPTATEPSRPRVVWGMGRREAFRRAAGRYSVRSRFNVSFPWDVENDPYPELRIFSARGRLRVPYRKEVARFRGGFGGETIAVAVRMRKVRYSKFRKKQGDGRRSGRVLFIGRGIVHSSHDGFDGLSCKMIIQYSNNLRWSDLEGHLRTPMDSFGSPPRTGEASIRASFGMPKIRLR